MDISMFHGYQYLIIRAFMDIHLDILGFLWIYPCIDLLWILDPGFRGGIGLWGSMAGQMAGAMDPDSITRRVRHPNLTCPGNPPQNCVQKWIYRKFTVYPCPMSIRLPGMGTVVWAPPLQNRVQCAFLMNPLLRLAPIRLQITFLRDFSSFVSMFQRSQNILKKKPTHENKARCCSFS